MLAFGVGAALPLLLLGSLSRDALLRWRGRMAQSEKGLKIGLGALLILAGTMTLTETDRTIQTALESAMPKWLLGPTTQI